MKILAIDTSCDETSVAVTDGIGVLANVVSSQVKYHKKFGGVVPFLAQRLHKERIDSVVELALQRAGLAMADMDALAVTHGPGLAPALQVGIEKACQVAKEYKLPLYPVNHMAGHIASCFTQVGSKKPRVEFPALALLVSGGHTELVFMEAFGSYAILGETLDDAIGEAYDKVAKMLGLGYPGGRLVAKLAEQGNPDAYPLPIPMHKSGDLNFSYSGLKNAVRLLIYEVKGGTHHHVLTKQELSDICASFERVAQASLLKKLELALKEHPEVKSLLLAGGVAANRVLRSKVRTLAKKYEVALKVPLNLKLCGDNAAMIGVAAYLGSIAGQLPVEPDSVDRVPGLRLE